jgi:hypothetical protein
VASGTTADGANARAHAAGQHGAIGQARHMGVQSGVASGAHAHRGRERGWQREGWKQTTPTTRRERGGDGSCRGLVFAHLS